MKVKSTYSILILGDRHTPYQSRGLMKLKALLKFLDSHGNRDQELNAKPHLVTLRQRRVLEFNSILSIHVSITSTFGRSNTNNCYCFSFLCIHLIPLAVRTLQQHLRSR